MDVTNAAVVLLDDLDNPAGTRFDQNRATVHNRVTIIPSAIFRRHIVVGDALVRQNRANSSRKAQSAACVEKREAYGTDEIRNPTPGRDANATRAIMSISDRFSIRSAEGCPNPTRISDKSGWRVLR